MIVCSEAPTIFLHTTLRVSFVFERLELRDFRLINSPDLSDSLQSLSACRTVAPFFLYYFNYNEHCFYDFFLFQFLLFWGELVTNVFPCPTFWPQTTVFHSLINSTSFYFLHFLWLYPFSKHGFRDILTYNLKLIQIFL